MQQGAADITEEMERGLLRSRTLPGSFQSGIIKLDSGVTDFIKRYREESNSNAEETKSEAESAKDSSSGSSSRDRAIAIDTTTSTVSKIGAAIESDDPTKGILNPEVEAAFVQNYRRLLTKRLDHVMEKIGLTRASAFSMLMLVILFILGVLFVKSLYYNIGFAVFICLNRGEDFDLSSWIGISKIPFIHFAQTFLLAIIFVITAVGLFLALLVPRRVLVSYFVVILSLSLIYPALLTIFNRSLLYPYNAVHCSALIFLTIALAGSLRFPLILSMCMSCIFVIFLFFTRREGFLFSSFYSFVSVVLILLMIFARRVYSRRLHGLLTGIMNETIKFMRRRTLLKVLVDVLLPRMADLENKKLENFPLCCVVFIEVPGFEEKTRDFSPDIALQTLNDVIIHLEKCCTFFDIHKIKSVGSVFLAVSGINSEDSPEMNIMEHTEEALDFAFSVIRTFQTNFSKFSEFTLRIGVSCGDHFTHFKHILVNLTTIFHSKGPLTAGILGSLKCQYDVFSDTVNVASRMCTTSEDFKIQVSEEVREIFKGRTKFKFISRGRHEIKGKGEMETFFVDTSTTLKIGDKITKRRQSVSLASLGILMNSSSDDTLISKYRKTSTTPRSHSSSSGLVSYSPQHDTSEVKAKRSNSLRASQLFRRLSGLLPKNARSGSIEYRDKTKAEEYLENRQNRVSFGSDGLLGLDKSKMLIGSESEFVLHREQSNVKNQGLDNKIPKQASDMEISMRGNEDLAIPMVDIGIVSDSDAGAFEGVDQSSLEADSSLSGDEEFTTIGKTTPTYEMHPLENGDNHSAPNTPPPKFLLQKGEVMAKKEQETSVYVNATFSFGANASESDESESDSYEGNEGPENDKVDENEEKTGLILPLEDEKDDLDLKGDTIEENCTRELVKLENELEQEILSLRFFFGSFFDKNDEDEYVNSTIRNDMKFFRRNMIVILIIYAIIDIGVVIAAEEMAFLRFWNAGEDLQYFNLRVNVFTGLDLMLLQVVPIEIFITYVIMSYVVFVFFVVDWTLIKWKYSLDLLYVVIFLRLLFDFSSIYAVPLETRDVIVSALKLRLILYTATVPVLVSDHIIFIFSSITMVFLYILVQIIIPNCARSIQIHTILFIIGNIMGVYVYHKFESYMRCIYHVERLAKRIEIQNKNEITPLENVLNNILPHSVWKDFAEGAVTSTKAISGIKAECSVVVLDVVGFTELAATIEAVVLANLLNALFSCYDICTGKYQAEKIRTIGDAYVIVSGLPDSVEQHCKEVLNLSFELLELTKKVSERFTEEIGRPVQVRVGICTGICFGGLVGDTLICYEVTGEPVLVATKLSQEGYADRVIASRQTVEGFTGLASEDEKECFKFTEVEKGTFGMDSELFIVDKVDQ